MTDSNLVRTVQFFAGTNSIGVVTNSQTRSPIPPSSETPFYLAWSNVLAGDYTLTAVATDSAGNTATLAVVTISVTNPPPVPFVVSFWYPTNGEAFLALSLIHISTSDPLVAFAMA